jgi:hypothetical protein
MISFPIRSGSDKFFLSVAFLVIRLGFHVLYLPDLKNQIGVWVLFCFFVSHLGLGFLCSVCSRSRFLLSKPGSGTIVRFQIS